MRKSCKYILLLSQVQVHTTILTYSLPMTRKDDVNTDINIDTYKLVIQLRLSWLGTVQFMPRICVSNTNIVCLSWRIAKCLYPYLTVPTIAFNETNKYLSHLSIHYIPSILLIFIKQLFVGEVNICATFAVLIANICAKLNKYGDKNKHKMFFFLSSSILFWGEDIVMFVFDII